MHQQAVEVTTAAPVVDTQSTAVSTQLDQLSMQELPTSGSFMSEVELSSGASQAGKDVGGLQNFMQSGYVILGASAAQTRYYYDGATMAPAGSGGGTTEYVEFNSIQSMQVAQGGGDATIASSGASINMVVKSGSNSTHGSFRDQEEAQIFESDNIGSGALRQVLSPALPEASPGLPADALSRHRWRHWRGHQER